MYFKSGIEQFSSTLCTVCSVSHRKIFEQGAKLRPNHAHPCFDLFLQQFAVHTLQTYAMYSDTVPKGSYWSPRITFTLWWSSQWFLEEVLQSDNCISATISVETITCLQQQGGTYINTVVSGIATGWTALFQVYWGNTEFGRTKELKSSFLYFPNKYILKVKIPTAPACIIHLPVTRLV